MGKAKDNTQVKVAKITAFQAIIVALITVLGGGIGYFAGTSGPNKPVASAQRWLVIQGVDGIRCTASLMEKNRPKWRSRFFIPFDEKLKRGLTRQRFENMTKRA